MKKLETQILMFAFCQSHSCLFIPLINISDNVEYPGSKRYSVQYLSICHWNLNSIAAHNYIKLVLLKAYLSIHEINILSLSEAMGIQYENEYKLRFFYCNYV